MLIYVSQMLIYVSQMLIAPPFHHQCYSISPPTLKQSSKQVAMSTSAEISKKSHCPTSISAHSLRFYAKIALLKH